MSLISLVIALRKAIQNADAKEAFRLAIELQSSLFSLLFGGLSAMSVEDKEKVKAELQGALDDIDDPTEDATDLDDASAQAWGDGKILEFLRKLLPIIIGLI